MMQISWWAVCDKCSEMQPADYPSWPRTNKYRTALRFFLQGNKDWKIIAKKLMCPKCVLLEQQP